ncbi:unnamed protein product [Gordionus sp. m RMFG-2023]|uniref:glutathione S-transferase 1-like isoform X1 n=1 Tax=Gordionus sp. m RMFG-2023 TaxID=3053472 RepID=UPI0030E4924A
MSHPIKLYVMKESGPCRAIWMTANALNIPIEIIGIDLFKGENKTPEFLKMNPFHTVPTIDDNGFIIWESRAIMKYFANKYGGETPLYPKDAKKRALVDSRLDFDIGKFYPALKEYAYPQVFQNKPSNPEREKDMQDALDNLEYLLNHSKYIAGDQMTLADISMFCTVSFLWMLKYDFVEYPKIHAWMEEMKKLPYYKETNQAFNDRMHKTFNKGQ